MIVVCLAVGKRGRRDGPVARRQINIGDECPESGQGGEDRFFYPFTTGGAEFGGLRLGDTPLDAAERGIEDALLRIVGQLPLYLVGHAPERKGRLHPFQPDAAAKKRGRLIQIVLGMPEASLCNGGNRSRCGKGSPTSAGERQVGSPYLVEEHDGREPLGVDREVKLPQKKREGERLLGRAAGRLGQGSVIELSKLAGEPLEILINQKLVARGEAVVVNEKFGVRITDIISLTERVKQLG